MTTRDQTSEHQVSQPADQLVLAGAPSRPFGLRYATRPKGSVELDFAAVRYDEQRQIAVALDGDEWVPIATHSMGITLQTTGTKTTEDEIYDKA